jgi:hypothetical protein
MFFSGNMITTTLDQCARDLQVATMDAFDQYFSQPLLSFIWALIPTRTGKLADLIMQSILIYRLSNSRTFIFNIPQGYPPAITNPKHNGEIGYGPKYNPTYTSPLIQKVRDTPKGAYYLLSDPIAEPNYLVTIQNYVYGLMYQLLAHMEAVKFIAYAWIEQKQQYLNLTGITTPTNQSKLQWMQVDPNYTGSLPITSNLNYTGPTPTINLEQLRTMENLWDTAMWYPPTGHRGVGYGMESLGEETTSLGDLIRMTQKRTHRYRWMFTIGLTTTITKYTLDK